ncbi:MAG: hypothetical protein JEZ14_01715 [Marinilabiliaceae bacterium]|nr:hypothetical protein [Marinilabiliaceae bacterium]
MRNTILVILLVAISISALCQKKKYKNAFVVSLNGDTISGLIQIKSKSSLCKGIKFKENGIQDSTIQFEPFEISSFCFTDKNKTYKSLTYKNNSKVPTHGFGELLFADEIRLYKLYQPNYEVNGIKYLNEIAYVIETDSMNYTLLQTRSVLKEQEEAFFGNQRFENSRSFNPVRKEYIGTLNCVFMD